jgi:hypothetical protein
MAALDTPLPAACTSTVCPGSTWPSATTRVREEICVRYDDVLRVASLRVLSEDGVLTAQLILTREAPRADAARDAGTDDDARAQRRATGPGADGLDLADHVGPEPVRVLELETGQAAADPEIEMVEGDSPDPHADFARAGVGHVDGLANEDFRAAVLAQDDGVGLHGRRLS